MRKRLFLLLLACCLLGSGCGQKSAVDPSFYDELVLKKRYESVRTVERMDGMAEDAALLQDLPSRPAVDAGAALLVSETEKKVLFAQNPTAKIYPASMTKCMTALLVLERVSDLGEKATVTKEAFDGLTEDASLADLEAGGIYTVRDILYALLLPSGNEAANVLAIHVAGSVEAFARLMNERALDLGMLNTHFQNPHGLHDPNHYTTVYDLYLLFRKVTALPEFLEIIGTAEYRLSWEKGGAVKTGVIRTTNSFLRRFTEPPEGMTVIGGKTGYTAEAGRCLILLSTDEKGSRYISVVARARNYDGAYQVTNALLEIAVSGGKSGE